MLQFRSVFLRSRPERNGNEQIQKEMLLKHILKSINKSKCAKTFPNEGMDPKQENEDTDSKIKK